MSYKGKGQPKQGLFIPKNIDKVIMNENSQNKGAIIYRSSWEKLFMIWLDTNPSVLKYSSEPFAIPYIKHTDGRVHKYYIDFYFECLSPNGTKRYLVEVKPKAETVPPVLPKTKTEKSMLNYQKRVETYYINMSKWESAKHFCKQHNLEFIIITEDELGL